MSHLALLVHMAYLTSLNSYFSRRAILSYSTSAIMKSIQLNHSPVLWWQDDRASGLFPAGSLLVTMMHASLCDLKWAALTFDFRLGNIGLPDSTADDTILGRLFSLHRSRTLLWQLISVRKASWSTHHGASNSALSLLSRKVWPSGRRLGKLA